MEFLEAKNHICSQEFLVGGKDGKSLDSYCTSQDRPPSLLSRHSRRLRGNELPVSIAPVWRLLELTPPPPVQSPETPASRTFAICDFFLVSSSPSRRGGEPTTSICSKQLSTAFLPSVRKANVVVVSLDCHLRLFNKIEAAGVGTCGFFQ